MERSAIDPSELVEILQCLDLDRQTGPTATEQDSFSLDALSAAIGEIHVPQRPDFSQSPTQTRLVAPNQRHHELHFEYPATQLMPRGSKLQLVEPSKIALRQQPKLGEFLLHPKNLPMYVRLPTQHLPAEVPDLRLYQPSSDNILEMIKSLSFPGISNLQVVYYKTAEGYKMYTTRLTTVWMTSVGRSQELVRDFTCNEESWDMLLNFHPGDAWVRTLRLVLERACDRSHLLVREIIKAKDPYTMHMDDKCLAPKWKLDERLIGPATMVLWCKLKGHSLKVEDEQGVGDMDIIALPCGHEIIISEHYIKSLTEDQCKAYACYHCGTRIFEQRHFDRIEAAYEWGIRDSFRVREQQWNDLLVRAKATKPHFSVSCNAFRIALHDALNAMEPPSSAVPPDLDPSVCDATTHLVSRLTFALDFQNWSIHHTSLRKTAEHFTKASVLILMRCLGVRSGTGEYLSEALPPGYAKFLVTWLVRTILLCWCRVGREKGKGREEEGKLAGMMGGVRVEGGVDVEMGG